MKKILVALTLFATAISVFAQQKIHLECVVSGEKFYSDRKDYQRTSNIPSGTIGVTILTANKDLWIIVNGAGAFVTSATSKVDSKTHFATNLSTPDVYGARSRWRDSEDDFESQITINRKFGTIDVMYGASNFSAYSLVKYAGDCKKIDEKNKF